MIDLLKNQKCLLTGASGFVGGHLATKLLDVGADVSLLLRDPDSISAKKFKAAGAKIFPGDLRDRSAVEKATKDQTYIFHIGAIFREAKFPDSVYYDINVGGTNNLLESASSCKRFIYCSTNGVHGGKSDQMVDESAPFNPTDTYQRSKLAAEEAVRDFSRKTGLRYSIIRPAMIWGDGDLRFKKLFQGVAQRKLPIIGTGRTWCHFISVHDLVESFLLAATKDKAVGEAYLIAGQRPVYLEYVYETIAKLASVKVLPFKVPVLPLQLLGDLVETICLPFGIEPPLHRRRADFFIKHRIFDISKAKRDLEFAPEKTFEAECSELFSWYKENGHLG
jgi:dihydroflavonol-4-reductase